MKKKKEIEQYYYYREVGLPITKIKKWGSDSACIPIQKGIMKLHKLEIDMKVRPFIFIREKLHSEELPEGKKIAIIDENQEVITFDSIQEKRAFEDWRKRRKELEERVEILSRRNR